MAYQFNRESARKLREEINSILESLGKKYGVKIDAGNCRFDDSEFIYKVTVKSSDPKVQAEREYAEFIKYAHLFDLKPEDFGAKFRSNGNDFKVCGLKLGRSKFTLAARRVDNGKVFLFVADEIAKKLHPELVFSGKLPVRLQQ